jgi:hypothetical protein
MDKNRKGADFSRAFVFFNLPLLEWQSREPRDSSVAKAFSE